MVGKRGAWFNWWDWGQLFWVHFLVTTTIQAFITDIYRLTTCHFDNVANQQYNSLRIILPVFVFSGIQFQPPLAADPNQGPWITPEFPIQLLAMHPPHLHQSTTLPVHKPTYLITQHSSQSNQQSRPSNHHTSVVGTGKCTQNSYPQSHQLNHLFFLTVPNPFCPTLLSSYQHSQSFIQ